MLNVFEIVIYNILNSILRLYGGYFFGSFLTIKLIIILIYNIRTIKKKRNIAIPENEILPR